MKKKEIEKTVLQKFIDEGYSSVEVCFTVKLKRTGIMGWLEDKKLINEKRQGFALTLNDYKGVVCVQDVVKDICSLENIKINGVR